MSHPNDNPQTPRPAWQPEEEQFDLLHESAPLVLRPGDLLFVMPVTGESWPMSAQETIQERIRLQLPEARVIALPYPATFATVAVEDAREP